MTQLSHTEKVNQLKKLSDFNFTNRTMLMLAGAEDLLTQERYKEDRYYIDLMYDIAEPELRANPEKPSKALIALAFNGAFRPEDYQRLIDAGKKASADELKEFLGSISKLHVADTATGTCIDITNISYINYNASFYIKNLKKTAYFEKILGVLYELLINYSSSKGAYIK